MAFNQDFIFWVLDLHSIHYVEVAFGQLVHLGRIWSFYFYFLNFRWILVVPQLLNGLERVVVPASEYYDLFGFILQVEEAYVAKWLVQLNV